MYATRQGIRDAVKAAKPRIQSIKETRKAAERGEISSRPVVVEPPAGGNPNSQEGDFEDERGGIQPAPMPDEPRDLPDSVEGAIPKPEPMALPPKPEEPPAEAPADETVLPEAPAAVGKEEAKPEAPAQAAAPAEQAPAQQAPAAQ